jgi:hypothetical protein
VTAATVAAIQQPIASAAIGMANIACWAAAASAGEMSSAKEAAITTQRRMYGTSIQRIARLYESARSRAGAGPREASLNSANGSR